MKIMLPKTLFKASTYALFTVLEYIIAGNTPQIIYVVKSQANIILPGLY
jgi:hypothetical protein